MVVLLGSIGSELKHIDIDFSSDVLALKIYMSAPKGSLEGLPSHLGAGYPAVWTQDMPPSKKSQRDTVERDVKMGTTVYIYGGKYTRFGINLQGAWYFYNGFDSEGTVNITKHMESVQRLPAWQICADMVIGRNQRIAYLGIGKIRTCAFCDGTGVEMDGYSAWFLFEPKEVCCHLCAGRGYEILPNLGESADCGILAESSLALQQREKEELERKAIKTYKRVS